jgi:signal transduction histidine kinase
MVLVVAATLASTILSAFLGALARRLSRARLWRDLERVWPVGAVSAIFGALDLGTMLAGAPWLGEALARAELAIGLLLSFAWLRYAALPGNGQPVRWERPLAWGVLALMLLALVPRAAVGPVQVHDAGLLGGMWNHASLTPFGHAAVLLGLAGAATTFAIFLRDWRRRRPSAGLMALSFAVAFAIALAEYLVRAGAFTGAHLLATAAAVPVVALAWRHVRRFVADADDLHALRERLEGLVEERTRDLAETHAALLQAEKLAALGQFAAGVAHEVNNPASVVTANLSHLSRSLADGMSPSEAKEVVDESTEAMRRINELVRKLLDAGRLADLPPGTGNVPLAEAVEQVLGDLRAKGRLDVELTSRVPDDLLVRGGAEVVERILANLVANAIEAIPAGRKGHVQVAARPEAQSVRVIIEDDGAGMAVDTLRRAFDPFFTTKPLGRGSGLGLPITRGLVEGIGGQIWLESEPGRGTLAVVELPAGTPA